MATPTAHRSRPGRHPSRPASGAFPLPSNGSWRARSQGGRHGEARARRRGAAVWHAVAGRPAAATVNATGRWFFDAGSLPVTRARRSRPDGCDAWSCGMPRRCGCSSPAPSIRPAARSRSPARRLPGVRTARLPGRSRELPPGAVLRVYRLADPRAAARSRGAPSSRATVARRPHPARLTLSMKTLGATRSRGALRGNGPAPIPMLPETSEARTPEANSDSFGIFDRTTPTPTPIAGAISSICSGTTPSWKRKSTGFDYRRSDGSPQGLVRIKL